MAAARTSRALSMAENEAAIATILRTPRLRKTFKLWHAESCPPATNLVSDIFSPRAGTSIAAGQLGDPAGREDQTHHPMQTIALFAVRRLRACHGARVAFCAASFG